MDKININNLKIFAHHGVLPEEKKNGQFFYVSAVLYTDTYAAGTGDDLTLTVNYDSVSHLINDIMTGNTYDLIETAANVIADAILTSYKTVNEVSITIKKPSAPITLDFEDVSVCVQKKYHTAYVALGSNLGDSQRYLNDAISSISKNKYMRNASSSSFIKTPPYGYTKQPDFLNACMVFDTLYTPLELLDFLQSLEQTANRVREIHWGPRTLDLDILFYDDITLYTDELKIPHPEIQKRAFVLEPLMELNPYLIHPVLNKSVYELYHSLSSQKNTLP